MIYKFNKTDYWGLGSIFIYLVLLFNTITLNKNSDFNEFLSIPFIGLILSISISLLTSYFYNKWSNIKDSIILLNSHKYNLSTATTFLSIRNINKESLNDKFIYLDSTEREIKLNPLLDENKMNDQGKTEKRKILSKISRLKFAISELIQTSALTELELTNNVKIRYIDCFDEKFSHDYMDFIIKNNNTTISQGNIEINEHNQKVTRFIRDHFPEIGECLIEFIEANKDLKDYIYNTGAYRNIDNEKSI